MKNRKFLSTFMAGVIATSMCMSLAACASNEDPIEAQFDSSKTNILVLNFDGGLGDDWLNEAIKRFEREYRNYSFSDDPDVKGVKVISKNDSSSGYKVLSSIKRARYNIYFTEDVYYNDFLVNDCLADITDVVTTKLTEFNEDRSIEDKMDAAFQDYLKVDNKYYAIPFWEGYSGIAYDIELFEQKGFYMMADGTALGEKVGYSKNTYFSDGKYIGSDALGTGPDGVSGTKDDGLPATHDEFFYLCDFMIGCSVTPLIWPGNYQDYVNEYALSMWADYQGYESMMSNYDFDGTDSTLVKSIDENGNITFEDPTEITEENGYILNKQAGKYYAIDFVRRIMRDSDYTVSNIMSTGMSHHDCNDNYLFGRFESSMDTIAMMIQGNWWQNEAKNTFDVMESAYGSSASFLDRRIGYMPFPKAVQAGGGVTVTALHSPFAFVNGNITDESVLKASKAFLRFICTNESLVDFHQIQGMSWALDYTMTEDELLECNQYARDLYDIHSAEKAIVYPYSSCSTYTKKASSLVNNGFPWKSNLSGTNYQILSSAFHDRSKLTTKQYFEGLSKADGHTASTW